MNKKQLDLTDGPILKTLTELAVPIMASSFLGTVYNITDMAWIGLLGSKAVAGIGVGGMYVWLSQGLVSLARMGGQVNAAQALGRRDRRSAVNYSCAAIQLTLLFAVLFSAICLGFTDPLLDFFQIGDALSFKYAKIYMQITCGLIIFSYLTFTLTGLYTAQGDSKTPLKANLAGLITNMILDPLLILGAGPFPRLEVAGAAVATVTAQALVLAVLLAGIFRNRTTDNILQEIRLFSIMDGQYYRSVFRIGVPTAVQGSVYCMISMVLTRMVAVFGPGAIATQRVGGQIESVSWNTADGFGAALNAFMAQNYGAKKPDRIRKGYKISFRVLAAWGLFIAALFVIFPRPMARLFFHEEDVITTAVGYLTIIGYSEPFMCIELMTVGALSGLGRTKLCSIISICLTGARVPLALLLTKTPLGLDGVWWALSLSSIVKGIVFYFTFQYSSRHLEGKKSDKGRL